MRSRAMAPARTRRPSANVRYNRAEIGSVPLELLEANEIMCVAGRFHEDLRLQLI